MTNTIPVAAFRISSDSKDARNDITSFQQILNGLNKTSLKDVDLSVQGLAKSVGGLLPVLSVGALALYANNATRAALATGDMAERAGVATSSFSRIQGAAADAGVSTEGLAASLRTYQNNLSEALRGNDTAVKSFQAVNLSARELKSLSLEDQLAAIAEGFTNTVQPVDRTRVAMDLFGKSGADLIPLLLKGSSGVKELMDAVLALDDRGVKALDRSAKAWERFKQSLSTGTANFFGDIAAGLFGSGDDILELEKKLSDQRVALAKVLAFRIEGIGRISQANITERRLAISALEQDVERLKNLRGDNRLELEEPTEGIVAAKVQAGGVEAEYAAAEKRRQEQQRIAEREEQDRTQRNQKLLDDHLSFAQRLNDETNALVMKNIATDVASVEAAEQQKYAAAKVWNDRKLELEKSYQSAKARLDQGAFNAAIGLLNAFEAGSRRSAIASIAINKALQVARAIQNTAAAVTAAAAYGAAAGGVPGAIASGAAIKALGAFEIATILATGFVEAGNVGRSNGGGFGGGVSTSYQSQAPEIDNRIAASNEQQRTGAQVFFTAPILNSRESADFIREVLEDLADRDVIDSYVLRRS